MTETEKEDRAAEESTAELLHAMTGMGVTPLQGNPLDTSCEIKRKGSNEVYKEYKAGQDRIKVVGDPYAAFAKGPSDIPL